MTETPTTTEIFTTSYMRCEGHGTRLRVRVHLHQDRDGQYIAQAEDEKRRTISAPATIPASDYAVRPLDCTAMRAWLLGRLGWMPTRDVIESLTVGFVAGVAVITVGTAMYRVCVRCGETPRGVRFLSCVSVWTGKPVPGGAATVLDPGEWESRPRSDDDTREMRWAISRMDCPVFLTE